MNGRQRMLLHRVGEIIRLLSRLHWHTAAGGGALIFERGFSYFWVLLMIALMGGGMALTGELYQSAQQRENERQLLFVGRQFQAALKSYHAVRIAGMQQYPATLENLLHDERLGGVRRHLRRIYTDPMTGGTDWALIRVDGKVVGFFSPSQDEPRKQAGFLGAESKFNSAKHYSDWKFVWPPDLLIEGNTASN